MVSKQAGLRVAKDLVIPKDSDVIAP